jgi:hypothetical protein
MDESAEPPVRFLVDEIGRLDLGFFLAPRFVAFQDAQPGRQSGKQQRQGVFTREIGGVGQGSRAHRHDTDRHHQDQTGFQNFRVCPPS